MTLSDVGRRVIMQYWLLIAITFVLAMGSFLVARHPQTTYTAAARLVLDTPDPASRQESAGVADTAKALATSPAEVRVALKAAHVERDADKVAAHSVSLKALGSSSVLELSVSDHDRNASAAIANALAAEVIKTRLAVTRGAADSALADTTGRIAAIDRSLARLATNENASIRRTALLARRSGLESERVSLLTANAEKIQPRVISAADVPTHADSTHLAVDLALVGILGVLIGVALAAIREMVWPTVVGADALTSAFGVPFLGALDGLPTEEDDEAQPVPTDVAQKVALAARAAHQPHVALVGAGPEVDLTLLAAQFAHAANRQSTTRVAIAPFRPGLWSSNGKASTPALIVVSPSTLTRAEYVAMENLLRITGAGQLGLVTYPRARPWKERLADNWTVRDDAAGTA
ncbi:MAG TPA: hypothetical protein VGI77_09220 [Gaiellaceae bacterium]|jgi:uncharacterized protein involved in exopolysaccharide biosynthesis